MSEYAVVLENISKQYALYNRPLIDRLKESLHRGKKQFHKPFEAVRPLSLKIKKGETVGIVGQNGAGKSTLLKLIAGVKPPSSGSVQVHGRIVALLELGAGFNPSFTGMENIYFYCSLIGLSRNETTALIPAILDFAEIGEYIHQPVKHYSSGMRARLAFSVSITVEPDTAPGTYNAIVTFYANSYPDTEGAEIGTQEISIEVQPLVEVEKVWSHTDVCFQQDNDGDGLYDEDPENYDSEGNPIDDDGDGLYNEDDIECDGEYAVFGAGLDGGRWRHGSGSGVVAESGPRRARSGGRGCSGWVSPVRWATRAVTRKTKM